jgi:RNA polymerase sigma factor (sigma-70 family)
MAAVPQVGRADTDVGSRTTHQLYEQYGRQIYAYCLQRLRSREEAEDAVQTTFLNAFRALQKGTQTQFEQAWLYKIAQHVCLERSESSGRRLQVESPTDLHVIQEVASAHAPEDTEQLIGVEDALAGMPAAQRDAIVLREWHGLSYREIGAQLNLSQSAVETLIFRARRTLAEALEHPQPERKKLSGGRMLNIGSFVTAIKTLLTGGSTVKMVAVAVTAGAVAVVGEKPAEHALRSHAHRLAPRSAHVQQAPTKHAAAFVLARVETSGRHTAPLKSRDASARGAATRLPTTHRQASHSPAKAPAIDDPATVGTTTPASAPPPPAAPEPAAPTVVATPTATVAPAVAPASAPAPPPKQTPAPTPGTGNGGGGTPAPQTGGDKGKGGTTGSDNGKDAGNGKTKGKDKGDGHGEGTKASSTSTADPTPAAAPAPTAAPDPSPSQDPAPAPDTGDPTSGTSSPSTTTTPNTSPATPAGSNDPGQQSSGGDGKGHGHDGGGNGQGGGGGDGGHGHGHGK